MLSFFVYYVHSQREYIVVYCLMIKGGVCVQQFIKTESGRVFNDTGDSNTRVLELINGSWVKPTMPVSFTELMDGTPLTEEEVKQLCQ